MDKTLRALAFRLVGTVNTALGRKIVEKCTHHCIVGSADQGGPQPFLLYKTDGHECSAMMGQRRGRNAGLIWRHNWQTRREVEPALFEYINGFYNPRRRHSALGWKSPVAFEQKAAKHEHLTGTKPVQVQDKSSWFAERMKGRCRTAKPRLPIRSPAAPQKS